MPERVEKVEKIDVDTFPFLPICDSAKFYKSAEIKYVINDESYTDVVENIVAVPLLYWISLSEFNVDYEARLQSLYLEQEQ